MTPQMVPLHVLLKNFADKLTGVFCNRSCCICDAGEQFATADFTTDDRMYIAMNLDKMGVDYIELANPAASETAYQVQAMATITQRFAHRFLKLRVWT